MPLRQKTCLWQEFLWRNVESKSTPMRTSSSLLWEFFQSLATHWLWIQKHNDSRGSSWQRPINLIWSWVYVRRCVQFGVCMCVCVRVRACLCVCFFNWIQVMILRFFPRMCWIPEGCSNAKDNITTSSAALRPPWFLASAASHWKAQIERLWGKWWARANPCGFPISL